MERNRHGQVSLREARTPTQAHDKKECQSISMMRPTRSPTLEECHSVSSSNLREQPHSFLHSLQQSRQELQQLREFWANQRKQIEEETTDFIRNHSFPLDGIERIMRADEDVKVIATEVPKFFAKACEMFIQDLTIRSWVNTEENKRETLEKSDMAAAVKRVGYFDFLLETVPNDENEMVDHGEEAMDGNGIPREGDKDPISSVFYHQVPPQQHVESRPPYPEPKRPKIVMVDQAHKEHPIRPFSSQVGSASQQDDSSNPND